jgi:hypothetical protein
LTETDGTRRVLSAEAPQTPEQGVDPTVRFVTWHTTVTVLVTLGAVITLALLGFSEAAAAAAVLGTAGGVVRVSLSTRR